MRYIPVGTNKPHAGWLDLGGGVRYYFDSKGLSVKGEVVIDGVRYLFGDDFRLIGRLNQKTLGIDVSKF